MAANAEAKNSALEVQTTAENSVAYTLAIKVGADRVAQAFDTAYRDLSKRARVKGFRPGKAPRHVLEKVYGDAVAEEIEHALVAETLPEAIEQAKLQPIVEPSVHAHPPQQGADFHYTAHIEVKPEIALGDWQGLKATRPPVSVDDAAVEKELDELRRRNAPFVEAPEGTQVAKGHFIKLDFEGKIDGVPFQGGAAKDQVLEIGSGRMIPGFEDQIVGAKVGDEVEVKVTFPEQYHAEELAGKAAVFSVKVHEIKKLDVPALDDEFAKDLGDFESIAALREKVRADLLKVRERDSKNALRKTLLDSALELVSFDVPQGLVAAQLRHRLQQMFRQFQGQLPPEVLQQQAAHYQEMWRPMMEREIREALLLDAVSRSEKFEVTEDELNAKIDQIAGEQGVSPERARKLYADDQLKDAIRAQILEERAVDLLVGRAQITDAELPAGDAAE